VFDLYGRYAGSLLTWAAAISLPLAIIEVTLTNAGDSSSAGAAIAALLALPLVVVGSAVVGGAYVIGLEDAGSDGAFPAFASVWERVQPRILALIGTSILAGLGVALGLILLVVPGLILLTWWALIAPIVLLEGESGTTALGRSRELIRGNAWVVFFATIVVAIIVGIAGAIIGGIVGALVPGTAGAAASSFASNTVTMPLSALVAWVIYRELQPAGADPSVLPDATVLPPASPDGSTPPASPQPTDGPFLA
jgi:hypothetical protein